jgi:hypothetical protein
MVLRTEDEKQKTIGSVSFFNNTEFLKKSVKAVPLHAMQAL